MELFKKLADEAILGARTLLETENGMNPVIIGITDGEMTPVTVSLENEEEEKSAMALLEEMSLTHQAVILMAETHFREVHKKDIEKVSENLDKDEEACEAILCAIFTEEGLLTKIMPYIKNEDNEYTFMDQEWMEDKDNGMFQNPYTK